MGGVELTQVQREVWRGEGVSPSLWEGSAGFPRKLFVVFVENSIF